MAFSVAKRRSIYIHKTLNFFALQGALHIYDISRLRVNIARAALYINTKLNIFSQTQPINYYLCTYVKIISNKQLAIFD
jgi:hypothetical protein